MGKIYERRKKQIWMSDLGRIFRGFGCSAKLDDQKAQGQPRLIQTQIILKKSVMKEEINN